MNVVMNSKKMNLKGASNIKSDLKRASKYPKKSPKKIQH